jgi:hypothetical protein
MESEHNFYVTLCLNRDANKASREVLYLRLESLNRRHNGCDVNCFINIILEKTTNEGFQ